MSEADKVEATARPIPKFLPGAYTAGDSLIVDSEGVAWWVRPGAMIMMKAEPTWQTPPSNPTT